MSHVDLHPLWRCPLCSEPLQVADNRLHCVNRHSFDRAREGYHNLLLPQHRGSKAPGDDRQMIRARRDFLAQGHYQPLLQKLQELACELLGSISPGEQPVRLMDCGAGEGYYTHGLHQAIGQQSGQNPVTGGVDISRDAARLAAKAYPELHFAVASAARLPLEDASMDLGLRVFAPTFAEESARVIRPRGFFIAVSPAEDHLSELRRLVYRDPRPYQLEPPQPMAELRHLRRETLACELNLEQAGSTGLLLAMTPYYWQADEATQERIRALEHFRDHAAFCIDIYRRS